MIEITYKMIDDEHVLTISGHAGFSGCGTDIVCAGVSALTYALLQTLSNSEKDGELSYLSYLVHDGVASIRVRPKCGYEDRIGAVGEVAVTGYRMIADAYPQNVKIKL